MRCDVIIVGGSYAGLAAALQIARARRSVLVIDSGRPRNRFASEAHGVLAQDGRRGSDILSTAREQLLCYPTMRFVSGEAVSAQPAADHVRVELADGQCFEGRRLLLATGIADELPDLPGLSERWGDTVLHCPYCHGYEIGGGAIGFLALGDLSAQQASLMADWGDVTFFVNQCGDPDSKSRDMLARRNVAIVIGAVAGLEGEGRKLDGVRMQDGRFVEVKALFLSARTRMASPLAESLGCKFDDGPLGPAIRTDDTKLTSVANVYAAGDAARSPHSISWACADGATAGVSIHHALVQEDCEAK